jgi:hypothetical protein
MRKAQLEQITAAPWIWDVQAQDGPFQPKILLNLEVNQVTDRSLFWTI